MYLGTPRLQRPVPKTRCVALVPLRQKKHWAARLPVPPNEEFHLLAEGSRLVEPPSGELFVAASPHPARAAEGWASSSSIDSVSEVAQFALPVPHLRCHVFSPRQLRQYRTSGAAVGAHPYMWVVRPVLPSAADPQRPVGCGSLTKVACLWHSCVARGGACRGAPLVGSPPTPKPFRTQEPASHRGQIQRCGLRFRESRLVRTRAPSILDVPSGLDPVRLGCGRA